MIDLETESLVAVSEVPRELPRRVHVSSVWRWIKNGVRGVPLETILVGGRRYTSREALARFFEATTAVSARDQSQMIKAVGKHRAIRQAERELDDANI